MTILTASDCLFNSFFSQVGVIFRAVPNAESVRLAAECLKSDARLLEQCIFKFNARKEKDMLFLLSVFVEVGRSIVLGLEILLWFWPLGRGPLTMVYCFHKRKQNWPW